MAIEAMIEREARLYAVALGGVCMKFVSPGNDGVPDRILSHGRCGPFFIEFKAPGKKLKPNQNAACRELAAAGARVYAPVDSIKKAKEIIEDEFSGFGEYRHAWVKP